MPPRYKMERKARRAQSVCGCKEFDRAAKGVYCLVDDLTCDFSQDPRYCRNKGYVGRNDYPNPYHPSNYPYPERESAR